MCNEPRILEQTDEECSICIRASLQRCHKCCKNRSAFRSCGSGYRFFSSLKSFLMNTGERFGRYFSFSCHCRRHSKPLVTNGHYFAEANPEKSASNRI